MRPTVAAMIVFVVVWALVIVALITILNALTGK